DLQAVSHFPAPSVKGRIAAVDNAALAAGLGAFRKHVERFFVADFETYRLEDLAHEIAAGAFRTRRLVKCCAVLYLQISDLASQSGPCGTGLFLVRFRFFPDFRAQRILPAVAHYLDRDLVSRKLSGDYTVELHARCNGLLVN